MRFSIVTPSFNPSFWIGLCIASVADRGWKSRTSCRTRGRLTEHSTG